MREVISNRSATADPSLLHRVKLFLHSQHISSLNKLHVELDNETAVISGSVGTFYERQVAVECCKRVAGVRKVVDQILVTPSEREAVEILIERRADIALSHERFGVPQNSRKQATAPLN